MPLPISCKMGEVIAGFFADAFERDWSSQIGLRAKFQTME